MNRARDDFTHVLEAWLDTTERIEDPAAVFDRVIGQLDATPQRRSSSLTWRLPRFVPILLPVALLLSALIGVALFTGGRVTPSGDVGDIAFVHVTYRPTTPEQDSHGYLWDRTIPSDPRILTAATDGGEPNALVAVPGSVQPPDLSNPNVLIGSGWNSKLIGPAVRWSPDGTYVAFRLFNDQAGIYVMNRDGSGLSRLVDLPLDSGTGMPFSAGLDWSSDGTRIAYVHPFGMEGGLYVVDVQDGRSTRIADRASRTVAWSPDGSTIAFAHTVSGQRVTSSELRVVGADGTGERLLIESDVDAPIRAVAWAPDGSKVAFVRDTIHASDTRTLYVVNSDGSGLRDLAGWSADGCCIWVTTDEPLAWSPDGRLIALIPPTLADAHDAIVLVQADGSGERVLTEGNYFDWSPDGSQLVVSDAGGPYLYGQAFDSYSIYVVNADGTGRRWLANGEYPAWSS